MIVKRWLARDPGLEATNQGAWPLASSQGERSESNNPMISSITVSCFGELKLKLLLCQFGSSGRRNVWCIQHPLERPLSVITGSDRIQDLSLGAWNRTCRLDCRRWALRACLKGDRSVLTALILFIRHTTWVLFYLTVYSVVSISL